MELGNTDRKGRGRMGHEVEGTGEIHAFLGEEEDALQVLLGRRAEEEEELEDGGDPLGGLWEKQVRQKGKHQVRVQAAEDGEEPEARRRRLLGKGGDVEDLAEEGGEEGGGLERDGGEDELEERGGAPGVELALEVGGEEGEGALAQRGHAGGHCLQQGKGPGEGGLGELGLAEEGGQERGEEGGRVDHL